MINEMTEDNFANPKKDEKEPEEKIVISENDNEEISTDLKEDQKMPENENNIENLENSPKLEEPKLENQLFENDVVNEDGIEEFSEEDEVAEEVIIENEIDFENYEKKDFAVLAEKMLAAMDKPGIRIADIKNVDSVLNEINPLFDEINEKERKEAKEKYKAENGNEEGFEFKNDNYTLRFESALIQIKEKRKAFFANLEAKRENYFETKTKLLERLREIVEKEETGASKENWEALKVVQNEWKAVGNMQSPHNGSLWSAFNALNDRFFDLRSIQNELKELDRKKNLEAKESVVEKVEEMAKDIKVNGLTNASMKKANELLNDYKHIGPGIRSEQQILWDRMKAAFDIIYDKRRALNDENKKIADEVYDAKTILFNKLKDLTNFKSESINDWNARTKEIMSVQDQWNNLKGPLPKEKAKEISKAFWSELKNFFREKSHFFKELESKRDDNYKKKLDLCQKIEDILNNKEVNQEITNSIINIQKEWKEIGQVPRKFNDEIYQRFKKLCDAYFDLKRDGSKDQIDEQNNNLKEKIALCESIEEMAKNQEVDLSKLKEFKSKFNEIGFVPRKNIKEIQERFVKAINEYVKGSGNLGSEEAGKILGKNRNNASNSGKGRTENAKNPNLDLQKKAKALEEEISLLRNNISFFGHSKGSEKLKEEYQKKIDKIQSEIDAIKKN